MKNKIIIWLIILLIVAVMGSVFFLLSKSSTTKKGESEAIESTAFQTDASAPDALLNHTILTFYNDDLSSEEKLAEFEPITTINGFNTIKSMIGEDISGHGSTYKKPSDEVAFSVSIENPQTYIKTSSTIAYETVCFFDLVVTVNETKNTSSYYWKCTFILDEGQPLLEDIIITAQGG